MVMRLVMRVVMLRGWVRECSNVYMYIMYTLAYICDLHY
jgi:hypothetical protein